VKSAKSASSEGAFGDAGAARGAVLVPLGRLPGAARGAVLVPLGRLRGSLTGGSLAAVSAAGIMSAVGGAVLATYASKPSIGGAVVGAADSKDAREGAPPAASLSAV